jgi:hypothetical protein
MAEQLITYKTNNNAEFVKAILHMKMWHKRILKYIRQN